MKKLACCSDLLPTRKIIAAMLHAGIKICFVLGIVFAASQIVQAQFTVNSLGDEPDALVGNGLCDSSSGCTLRAAIQEANFTAAADTINFSVAGTITPATSLPTIIQPVTINGYTAPLASANSAAINVAFNGNLVVELNGSNAGGAGIGLRISASNCTIQGLVINRFQDSGIRIDAGTGARIYGNFIGTDLAGTAALGNFNRGILINGSTGNFIGSDTGTGLGAGSRNIISGNFGTGISVTNGGSATIKRNFIGTDKNGTAKLGNTQEGIRIVDSSNNLIGGGGDRNVISGNDGSGVAIIRSDNTTNATANTISSNFIGVDRTGNTTTTVGGFQTSPVGNNGSGVLINAPGNTMGGTAANAVNIISGNAANGISINSNFATGNVVTRNTIGFGANGTTAIGNRDNGIQISNLASDNNIGSITTNLANIIANNGDAAATSARAGVYLDETAGTGNAIRGNSIFMNTGIGIDLGLPGPTANDLDDPDTGANNLQNTPALTAADATANTISGTLNSNPNTNFTIDFYSNTTPDTLASSEGRTYIGSINVMTDAGGDAAFTFPANAGTLTAGQFITATATSLLAAIPKNTSEFSNAQTVTTGPPAPTGKEGDVNPRPSQNQAQPGVSGNGELDGGDVTQVRRFVLGEDTPDAPPNTSNEFQKADTAPYATRGDGELNGGDVTQIRRYVLGEDAQQVGGGPAPGSLRGLPEFSIKQNFGGDSELNSPAATYTVRPVAVSRTGNTLTVGILLNTDASKTRVNSVSFTLNFTTTDLNTPTNCRPGSATVSGGTTSVACGFTGATMGRVTFQIDLPVNQTFDAGVQQIALIDFNVPMGANGTTTLSFSDTPTPRFIGDVFGNRLDNPDDSAFVATTISTVGPTASSASISGRLKTADGAGLSGVSVMLFDTRSGETIYVTTDASGVYVFEGVPVGNDYIVTPLALRYSFNPLSKYLSLTEELTTIDFVGVRKRGFRKF